MDQINNKTFRLFISSTFSDFKKERDILRTEVFPIVEEYYQKQGFVFQPIDLRWGVTQEAQLDQKTLEMCLNEVRSCKTYPHPNFLIMLGDRYGWIPLPYCIEQNEFEKLLRHCSEKDVLLLKHWYILDLNQIPASYTLRERRGEGENPEEWESIENQMRITLQEVAKQVLDEVDQKKYFQSATESEVIEGIFNYSEPTEHQKHLIGQYPEIAKTDANHIFGFFRSIEKRGELPLFPNAFIGEDYEKAQDFKTRVAGHILPENTFAVTTVQKNSESLSIDYYSSFKDRIIKFLKSQLAVHKVQQSINLPLKTELETHAEFAIQKRQSFLGREGILNDIKEYLKNGNTSPLLIHGPSGRGKSAIMAKAIESVESASSQLIAYRFVGASSEFASSKVILKSIFEELEIPFEKERPQIEMDKNQEFFGSAESESFENFSYRAHDALMGIKRPTIIFLDALDQLSNKDYFLWLPKKLTPNIKIVISALDDEKYPEESETYGTLKTKTKNLLEVPAFELSNGINLIKTLLTKEKRQLQHDQIDYFKKQYEQVLSPLYVQIAAQELKHWKSYDSTPDYSKEVNFSTVRRLANSQEGIIKEFIENLSKLYYHNQEFVFRVLGFLLASRKGLSEYELLTLINIDDSFIKIVVPEIFHENITNELPNFIWIRLYNQLAPFLNKKVDSGQELLSFFHRDFISVTKDLKSNAPKHNRGFLDDSYVVNIVRSIFEHHCAITSVEKVLYKVQKQNFNSNRWGFLHIILINNLENRLLQGSYSDFISRGLTNDSWKKDYIEKVRIIGLRFLEEINIEASLKCFNFLERICGALYHDSKKWILEYTSCLMDLSAIEDSSSFITSRGYLSKALGILEKRYSENQPQLAENYSRVLLNLGGSYAKDGNLTKSLELTTQSYNIRKECYLNEKKWATIFAFSAMQLGVIYSKNEQKIRAHKYIYEGYLIIKKLYSLNLIIQSDYVDTLIQLVTSYLNNDKIEKGFAYALECKEISNEQYKIKGISWGKKNVESYNLLASCYRRAGRFEDAISLQKKALKVTEKLFDHNNLFFVEFYMHQLSELSLSCSNIMGKGKLAIKLSEDVQKMISALYKYEPNRWRYLYCYYLNALSHRYSAGIGKRKEALALFNESLSIQEIEYLKEPFLWSGIYTTTLSNLASWHGDYGTYQEAAFFGKKSIEIRKRLYQKEPHVWLDSYCNSLDNLAHISERHGKWKDALKLQKRSFLLMEKVYELNRVKWYKDYFNILDCLSRIYYELGSFDEYKSLFKKAIFLLETYHNESGINNETISRLKENIDSIKLNN